MTRMTGGISWLDEKRGYGFIDVGDGVEDVFVHHSAIGMARYSALRNRADKGSAENIGEKRMSETVRLTTVREWRVGS